MLAGILFGLMAYKPQFGLLIPVALAAGGCWRAFAAASATVAGFVGLSLAAWGPEPWQAFFASLALTAGPVMEAVETAKLRTVWAAARLLGLGGGAAMVVQGLALVLAAVFVGGLWRRPTDYAFKAAGLVLGALLAAPHAHDYDLVLLAIPILFLLRHGQNTHFEPWQKTGLAALWLLPLVARPLAMAHLPLAVAVLALMMWGIWRWAGLKAAKPFGDEI